MHYHRNTGIEITEKRKEQKNGKTKEQKMEEWKGTWRRDRPPGRNDRQWFRYRGRKHRYKKYIGTFPGSRESMPRHPQN